MGLKSFFRVPIWLKDALGLSTDEMPYQVDTDTVIPVLDVGQGGFGSAQWATNEQTHPASTAATNYDIEATQQLNLAFLIVGCAIAHNIDPGSAAVPGIAQVTTTGINSTINTLGKVLLNVNDRAPFADIFNSVRPIYIPPGYGFRVSCPTTVADEQWSFSVIYARIRAGYKAI